MKKEEDNKLTKAELKRKEAELMRKAEAKRMGIDLDEVKKEKKEKEKENKIKEKEKEERKADGRDDRDDESSDDDPDIKPNMNHILRDKALEDAEKYDKVIDASGLDNALSAMDDKVIKHPEKKVKAAWEEFLEKRLPELKAEYPNFKRTKHIDILRKEVNIYLLIYRWFSNYYLT